MSVSALALDPWGYEPHRFHRTERVWSETNCYVDLWIEILHALGFDAITASAFTLSTDFEGDQWTMFKFPLEDLRNLYGIEVVELNVWRPLSDHVVEQLGFGRLVTVDVDTWFLPDTRGVSYRTAHQKTTIAVETVDLDNRRLRYFHNAGYFELEGDDFDGIMCLGEYEPSPWALPPYVEVVRLDRLRKNLGDNAGDADNTGDAGLVDRVRLLAKEHLSRRPDTNPVSRFLDRLRSDLPWLASHDLDTFHRYAFGTCRQCGASAELAADFVDWLAAQEGCEIEASKHLRAISDGAKTLQFALARAVRGRNVDLDEVGAPMEIAWERAMSSLVDRYGG
ncbi:MAG TPA: DUF1839 family protein [Acidimicrobiales bacterium]|nr:DUF1839 family protein [Acidimicrobiales bacterium]